MGQIALNTSEDLKAAADLRVFRRIFKKKLSTSLFTFNRFSELLYKGITTLLCPNHPLPGKYLQTLVKMTFYALGKIIGFFGCAGTLKKS